MVLDYIKTGGAYQVEIIRDNGKYYVHVTIEEAPATPCKVIGVTGVDTNPDGLGVAFADYYGQYRGSMWLGQGEWTYARSNRRNNLIGEMAKQVVVLAKAMESALAVEDLEFKNDKSVTAKFNRMSHGFVWSKFLQYVDRCATRVGVPIIKVNPAFSSVIGILKYQHMHGISNHESAGYIIARRGLGYEHEKIPKELIDNFIKNKHEFMEVSNWKQWSAIKKASIAKMRKLTGKKVQSLVQWQVHRKKALGIG
jgi:IS605 OrfB family transposase